MHSAIFCEKEEVVHKALTENDYCDSIKEKTIVIVILRRGVRWKSCLIPN